VRPTSLFSSSYDNLTRAIKELASGFMLGTTDGPLLSMFNVKLPSEEMGKTLNPGDGLFFQKVA